MRGLVISVLAAACTAAGCRGKERHQATNDRVRVEAPFVNVRVGEEGGVNVRAPFTNVQTPGASAAPPAGSTQYAPLAPASTSATSRFRGPSVIPPATPTP